GPAATLVTVGAYADLQRDYPQATPVDAGFAITPTVVNAHTHLDLSAMPHNPGGYVHFIGSVIFHDRAGRRGLEPARQGVAELRRLGVSVIGDIVARAEVMDYLLGQDDVRGVAYWEVLSPDPASAELDFQEVVATVNRFRSSQRPGGMVVGVAPHTPHTVSARLLQLVTRWAHAEGLPIAIHVGESPGETRLHRHGDGPLASSLRDLGLP